MYESFAPERIYSLSVLVPAYNEEDSIEKTLLALINSDYKGLKEIVAINDGSKDRTLEIMRRLQRKYALIKVLDKVNSGKADSLNQGIKIARGELVAVVDADSCPEKNAISNAIGFFNEKKVGAVTSNVLIRERKTFFGEVQAMEYLILAWTRKIFDFIDAVFVTNGPLSIYRRKVLLEVGGFDKNTVTEDIDLTWNILNHGYQTRMSLSSVVTTTTPESFLPWKRQRERWGIGGIQAIFKYRKIIFKKGLLGLFIIPFVIVSILLSIFVSIFLSYIFLITLLKNYFSLRYTIMFDLPLIRLDSFNPNPSVLLLFIGILFLVYISYMYYVIDNVNKRLGSKSKTKGFVTRIAYLVVYCTLYPYIWLLAISRMIKGDYKW